MASHGISLVDLKLFPLSPASGIPTCFSPLPKLEHEKHGRSGGNKVYIYTKGLNTLGDPSTSEASEAQAD